MRKNWLIVTLFALALPASPAMAAGGQWVKLVVRLQPLPSAQMAVVAGRAVLVQAYGKKKVADEEPLIAKRNSDVWVVSGTLNCFINMPWWQKFWYDKILGYSCFGGTDEVKLSAKDGNLLQVTHGQ